MIVVVQYPEGLPGGCCGWLGWSELLKVGCCCSVSRGSVYAGSTPSEQSPFANRWDRGLLRRAVPASRKGEGTCPTNARASKRMPAPESRGDGIFPAPEVSHTEPTERGGAHPSVSNDAHTDSKHRGGGTPPANQGPYSTRIQRGGGQSPANQISRTDRGPGGGDNFPDDGDSHEGTPNEVNLAP